MSIAPAPTRSTARAAAPVAGSARTRDR
jgi:hypothetical protein